MSMSNEEDRLTPIQRLTRDLANSARTLGKSEARFLVDAYYTMQDQRIRAANQVRSLEASGEPHDVLKWYFDQNEVLEKQVQRALAKYAEGSPVGQWALSVYGIGPVITAGLLAHIDLRPWRCHAHKMDPKVKACRPKLHEAGYGWTEGWIEGCTASCGHYTIETVGHIWSFAGLDPSAEWGKGERRPWNADLKVLCWKIGESFVKFHKRPECFYGHLFAQRKELEVARNERGDFLETARRTLEKVPNHAQREIYATGRLPDGRIHARARRYAVKIFLAHLHDVWYRHDFGRAPPLPYPIAIQGHADVIPVPNQPNGVR